MSNRHQELASPEQTVSGKDFLNPLIVDSLLKTIWFINAPCFCNEALAIPGQTETGKEFSNPLMADSLPKTILSTKFLGRLKACCCIIIGEKVTTARKILNTDGLKVSTAKKRFLNAHNAVYVAPSLKQKLFSNMKIRFSGVHVPLFDTMLLHDQSGQVARVTSLETELKKTKEVHGKALTKLIKKVKRLEDKLKSTNERKKAKIVISDEEEELVLEDSSKQGRMEEIEYEDVEEENAGVECDFDLTEQQVTHSKSRNV
ncbi:hypothetical protein Tco_1085730 [Tanacetum coccineum]